jgi:hypothetical protein
MLLLSFLEGIKNFAIDFKRNYVQKVILPNVGDELGGDFLIDPIHNIY